MPSEIDAATESAKATQEVAKAAGQGIALTRDLGGFLNRVFGVAIEDTVGLLWGDKIAAKRIEAVIYDVDRLASLLEKARRRLDELKIVATRPVPPKVGLPLLEYATVEHEDALHSLWANLLATAMDAQAEQIHRKYITTLGEMTTEDAFVLSSMFKEADEDIAQKESRDSSLTYGPGIDGTYTHGEIAVITLNKLGLITPAYIKFKTYLPGGHHHDHGDFTATQDDVSLPGDLASVKITEYGYAFGRAAGLIP